MSGESPGNKALSQEHGLLILRSSKIHSFIEFVNRHVLGGVLLCIGLCLSPCRADQMADDFAWFNTLGYPDVKGLQHVRYIEGWSTTGGFKDYRPMWGEGFLIKDMPKSFQVLTLNFVMSEITKANPFTEENHFEPDSLRKFAESRIKLVQDKKFFAGYFGPGPLYSPRAALFVLAWACWRQGETELAANLYLAAQKADGVHPYGTPSDDGWAFRQKLQRDLGQFNLWRIMLDFGDPSVPRPELLKKLRNLQKNFPCCDYMPRVNETADTLEMMIAEDQAHPTLSEEQIAKLKPEEQVREWIFYLRNQNGHQMGQPGSVDIFETWDKKQQSPAEHLVKLGDAAVPQLIKELGDKRFTRSVGCGRDFFFSHDVVSTGRAAEIVLERIANRRFDLSGGANTEDIRKSVLDWWSEHQSKGEKAEMMEAVARGDFNAPQVGEKLLEKYPDAALTPLMIGVASADDWGVRSDLIHLVAKLKDERVQPFLLKEVKEGTLIGARAQAAYELCRLGNLDGIPPLAEVWLQSKPEWGIQNMFAREKLVDVLGTADTPIGINALATGLTQRSTTTRSTVLETMGDDDLQHFIFLFKDFPAQDSPRIKRSAATKTAIENLLAGELEDTGGFMYEGQHLLHISSLDSKTRNLRLGEYAAYLLAQNFPEHYQFDPTASFDLRERQRVLCLNTWRGAHGLAPLPIPPEPGKVKPEYSHKIARVIYCGDKFDAPDTVKQLLATAVGQESDRKFFHKILSAYCAANKEGINPQNAIIMDAIRGDDGTGVSLLVRPKQLKNGPINLSDWCVSYSIDAPPDQGSGGSGFKPGAKEFLPVLPKDRAFSFSMFYGPSVNEEDDTL